MLKRSEESGRKKRNLRKKNLGGGHLACGILVSRPGIEPRPLTVKVQCLNHWTTRKLPKEEKCDLWKGNPDLGEKIGNHVSKTARKKKKNSPKMEKNKVEQAFQEARDNRQRILITCCNESPSNWWRSRNHGQKKWRTGCFGVWNKPSEKRTEKIKCWQEEKSNYI